MPRLSGDISAAGVLRGTGVAAAGGSSLRSLPAAWHGPAGYTPGVSERRSGVSKFCNADYLNSITRETDATQATTATKQYDAFGVPISASGSSASPFGFAGGWGYQEDPDSGLKLLGHRYYDPSTGRFLTRDSARHGRNWYGYCANNPLSWVDSDGCKRKLVVLLGVYLGPDIRPTVPGALAAYLTDDIYANYDVKFIAAKNPQVVKEAIEGADAALLDGHGHPFCTRQSHAIFAPDVDDITEWRQNHDKGKLDFVILSFCYSVKEPDESHAWCRLAHQVYGYDTTISGSEQESDPYGKGTWLNDDPDPGPPHYALGSAKNPYL